MLRRRTVWNLNFVSFLRSGYTFNRDCQSFLVRKVTRKIEAEIAEDNMIWRRIYRSKAAQYIQYFGHRDRDCGRDGLIIPRHSCRRGGVALTGDRWHERRRSSSNSSSSTSVRYAQVAPVHVQTTCSRPRRRRNAPIDFHARPGTEREKEIERNRIDR